MDCVKGFDGRRSECTMRNTGKCTDLWASKANQNRFAERGFRGTGLKFQFTPHVHSVDHSHEERIWVRSPFLHNDQGCLDITCLNIYIRDSSKYIAPKQPIGSTLLVGLDLSTFCHLYNKTPMETPMVGHPVHQLMFGVLSSHLLGPRYRRSSPSCFVTGSHIPCLLSGVQ